MLNLQIVVLNKRFILGITILCLLAAEALIAKANGESNMSDNSTLAIKANRLEYSAKDKIYYLTGNASMIKGLSFVAADYIEFYEEQTIAVAKGNVYYDDKDITIRASSALLNTAKKTGSLVKATVFVKNGNYHVSGDYLIKSSDKEYWAQHATITTCDSIPSQWCIYANEANIEIDEQIKATGVTGKVYDLPVFYTPVFSTALKRTTGFLTPGFGYHNDKGTYISVPFYWAIADNKDMTVLAENFSRKGLAEGIEYRYVEEGGIEGTWWTYHLHDKSTKKDYFVLKGKHTQSTNTDGLSAFFDINYLNESDYYKLYSPNFQLVIQRFLESTAEGAYSTDKYRAYLLSQYFTDLQYKTDLASQKLPEVGFTLHPIDLWQSDIAPGKLSVTTSVSNFISNDGVKGERFYLYPKLYSSTGDTVRFMQTGALRAGVYSLSGAELTQKNVQEAALIYNAEVNTSLIKRYPSFTHVIEPSVGYLYLSDGSRVQELDSFEDFNKTSEVDLSIMNYFKNSNGTFLFFRITEPYYTAKSTEQFGPLKLQARLESIVTLKADAAYDLNNDYVKNVNTEVRFNVFKTDLALGQRYDKDKSTFFLTGGMGYNIMDNLRLNAITWYDTKGEGLRNLTVDLLYTKQCWGVDLLYRKTHDRYSVYLFIELKGLGIYKFFGV
ncbi:MAG: LPS-assembly protein LptD [Nitrospirae bacterium]|nr:LPS-assembly protein LptD [Nitrospirota bacterium]